MTEQSQPYVGPRPFKREDAAFFFGRTRESNELLSLVISHAAVVLYSQSGAGKTSLINAKLLSLLEEGEGLDVLPLATMRGPPSTLPPSQIANIYVFNTLVRWAKGAVAQEKLAKMTLREFLKQREQPIDNEGLPKPCVAIFDQFEELFTCYPEHWEQRRGFFEQVRDALDANPRLRTLFAMREDYVAAVDPYARIMPEEFRIRFHLENLREPRALEAIKGPLTRDQRRHFAEGVAEKLVKELMKTQVETAGGQTESITSEFVEPIMLQVVCERLWRDLNPEDTEITFAHLETANVETALLSFYEDSVQKVAQQTHIPESALRSWFEKQMVTPAGTRGMVFRGDTETEGLCNDAVDELEALHLVRSELRGGSRWYELTHDRFIDAIQKSRQKVLLSLQAGAEERRREWEAKAVNWVSLGRNKRGLLRDVELLETERWLNSPDAVALGSSETLLALVEASRADVQERSARRRKRWLFVMGAVCFMTLLAAAWALIERSEASRQRQVAESHAALTLARNLTARSAKYKKSDLRLALLLNLEANRMADEINPETRLLAEAKTRLLAEAKGGLLDGLVSSPHLRAFLFHGHTAAVRSVAFSPDGKKLASGSLDGKVILWDLAGYPLGPPLTGQGENKIVSVAFSPDGKKLASCGTDGNIVLWDVEKHEKIKSVPVNQGKLNIVAFNPYDGNTLACGTQAGTVVLLEVESGVVLNTLSAHNGRVYGLAFSPKAKKFASSGEDKKIVFWDFSSLKADGAVEDNDEVGSVAFSPDGETLASGNLGKEVALWNVAKRERLGSPMLGHNGPVMSVAFSPDGRTLVSGSYDKTIRRWDVGNRKPIGESLGGSSEPVFSVAFNSDGETLASGAGGGVTVLWDNRNQSVLAQRPIPGGWVLNLALTPNGKTMAMNDSEGNIKVASENVDEPETFNAHKKIITSLAFNSDGTTLASASKDGSIQLRSSDGKTWNHSPRSLLEQAEPIWSIAFSPKENRTLVSGDDNGLITFWDVPSGTQVGTLPKQEHPVSSVAFSLDGKILASGLTDGTIVLWNVATRQGSPLPGPGHADAVLRMAFSPDGSLLASVSHDNAVILWDVVTGQRSDIFLEHTASVRGVAFSPDGKTVASCSDDKSIILWDVAARQFIGSLVTEDQDDVSSVAFTPDGVLISAGWGVTFWDVRLDSLSSSADFITGRELTRDEWKHFLPERSYRPTPSVYGRLREADMLALQGEREKARKVFDEVVRMSVKNGNALLCNQIAWYGSLDNLADIILPVCDRAVTLANNELKPGRCDTRGLARAMTGKIPEAIEDFQAFVTWLKTEEEREEKAAQHSPSQTEKARHQNIEASYKKKREKREQWIVELKSGRNPFDAATLMALRREVSE
jgi:WD40 repeat protein